MKQEEVDAKECIKHAFETLNADNKNDREVLLYASNLLMRTYGTTAERIDKLADKGGDEIDVLKEE